MSTSNDGITRDDDVQLTVDDESPHLVEEAEIPEPVDTTVSKVQKSNNASPLHKESGVKSPRFEDSSAPCSTPMSPLSGDESPPSIFPNLFNNAVVVLHLSSSQSQDFIPQQKMLSTKQKVFTQIREIEEKRAPRHSANLKLGNENWSAMKNHLDKGYTEIKNLVEYIYIYSHLNSYASKFLEAHKKLIFTHQYLQRAIIPTLTSYDSKGEQIDTSLQPMMKALQQLHEGSIDKLNEFIKTMSSSVIDNKLKPMKEQYKIEIENLSEELKSALKNYEKVGKNCIAAYDKLNDTLTKTIKSKEEGKMFHQDFWTDQANYVAALNIETDTRQYLQTHLSQAYERIKDIEKTRIESTQSAMEALVQTTQQLYKELGKSFDQPLSNATIDPNIDINRLSDVMSTIKEKQLSAREQILAQQPPADVIPTIADSPLVLKYGVLALQSPTLTWDAVHVVVTQDAHMLIYKSIGSETTEKFLASQANSPFASIFLSNSVVAKREVVNPCAFQVIEKKKQIMWSTTAKYMLRVSSEEDLLEWMDLFMHMHVTEDSETFSI